MKTFLAICFFFISALQMKLMAQRQAFDFVLMPHSVSTFGMGEQGVAFPTNDDALVYNPAKLSLTKNTRISFFRNPQQMAGFGPFPLMDISIYHNAGIIGSFGISYENLDYGELNITGPDSPESLGKYHSFERSFSAGYSRDFNNGIIAGAQLRYAYSEYSPKSSANGLYLSLGLIYYPEWGNKKFTMGLSLMNIGTAVKTNAFLPVEESQKFYSSPPTQLNFGFNYTAFENNYFTLPVNLSISKPFDKTDKDGNGESSFKALIGDWSDFPRDVSLHTGIGFQWKPLNIGNDFSFIQEFFIGDYSRGPKSESFYNFHTQGANIGFSNKDFKFTVGYAGVSHNVHAGNFSRWEFPYETFQFSMELNDNILFKKEQMEETGPLLKKVILSFGFGITVRTGQYKFINYGLYNYSSENTPNYSIEAAFYFDNDNALVSSLQYNSVPYKLSFGSFNYADSKYETFAFFSSYRCHPVESFHYLYLQGGAGIYRLNPVQKNTYPRYDYKTAFQLSTGLLLDFLSSFIIIPAVDYNLILFPTTGRAPRISGNNQFIFLLKIGYVVL